MIGRDGLKEALLRRHCNGALSSLPVEHLSVLPVGVDPHFGPETLRQVVDMCWLFKVNYLHLHLTDDQVNALIGGSPGTPLPGDKTRWQVVIETLNWELEQIPFAYGPWTEGQDPSTAQVTTANFEVVEPAAVASFYLTAEPSSSPIGVPSTARMLSCACSPADSAGEPGMIRVSTTRRVALLSSGTRWASR